MGVAARGDVVHKEAEARLVVQRPHAQFDGNVLSVAVQHRHFESFAHEGRQGTASVLGEVGGELRSVFGGDDALRQTLAQDGGRRPPAERLVDRLQYAHHLAITLLKLKLGLPTASTREQNRESNGEEDQDEYERADQHGFLQSIQGGEGHAVWHGRHHGPVRSGDWCVGRNLGRAARTSRHGRCKGEEALVAAQRVTHPGISRE